MSNFGYIALFGILGTILSFIALSSMIIFWNDLLNSSHSNLRLSSKECLLLASVLCATDTVAALTIVKEKNYPTLNSILFGEGVVNDAVSILLFRAVERLMLADINGSAAKRSPDSQERGGFQIMSFSEMSFMLMNFAMLSICSIFIGIAFGLGNAYLYKKLPALEKNHVREIFLLLLFAYTSYIVSELIGFSGVITLFVCAFTMAYYSFQNLSPQSKIGSVLAIETIGHAAEAFVFTYLGLCIYGMEQEKFSYSFFFAVLISCIIARAIGVFIPFILVNLCKRFNTSLDIK